MTPHSLSSSVGSEYVFLLDTNVWIEVFKKNPLVRKEFGTVENSEIGLSAIVLGELKVGFKKRGQNSRGKVLQ